MIDRSIAMELQGNLNRAQSLKQLKHIEMVRHQFRKLRIYLDKHTLSSPRSIQIPNDDGTSSSITDTNQMHQTIMSYNQRHFNQAQGPPPTTSPLKTILGDGLDHNSQQILDGNATLPTKIPTLMSQFLRNLKQTHQHNETPIFTQDKIIQAFKKWKESTTTSPSGLHLGHYKALIEPDGGNTTHTHDQSQ